MTSKDDISAFVGNTDTTFSCKCCKKTFFKVLTRDVIGWGTRGIDQQEVDKLVNQHLAICAGAAGS
jgi:hypothetical protein